MEESPNQLATALLHLFLSTIEEMNDDERRQLAIEIHQAIVIFDDRICDRFNLSRKARKKYVKDRR